LTDQVRADVGRLGVDAAAELGEEGNEARAERKADDPEWCLCDRRVVTFCEERDEPVDTTDAEEAERNDEEARDSAAAEGDDHRFAHSLARGRGGPDIAANCHVHANVAGDAR